MSVTPLLAIAKVASLSGRLGEQTILTTLDSPLPFLSARRVVEACAMMLPPMGFTPPPAGNMPPPPSRLAATTCHRAYMSTAHMADASAKEKDKGIMAKTMMPGLQRHHRQTVDVVRCDCHQLQARAQFGTTAMLGWGTGCYWFTQRHQQARQLWV